MMPCMKHGEFYIGLEFWSDGRLWRCTDVGRRTVAAIRIDSAEMTRSENGRTTTYDLTRAQAEAAGWFDGPPYAVLERLFDEYDQEGCSSTPDDA